MVKVRVGAIEESLIEKTKQYKEITGVNTVELIEKLLTDFFKDSLLTNTFIDLKEPLYFINNPYYYENGIIKATAENPIGYIMEGVKVSAEDVYIIKQIPNNLDTFNKEFNKYCYENNPDRHKGVYIYHEFKNLTDVPEDLIVENTIYIFDYNEAENTVLLEEVAIEDLDYRLELENHYKAYEDITEEYENYINWIYESNLTEDNKQLYENTDSDYYLNYLYVTNSFEVIDKYEEYVSLKNYLIKTGQDSSLEDMKNGVTIQFIREGQLVKPSALNKLLKDSKK